MKKLIFILIALLLAASTGLAKPRPKVALVLSGGIVTRGLSEIGVIKALEEENVPIDYVAGTSMGAVLGSLLAQGYNANQIEALAKSIDWMQAFMQTNEYQNLLFGEKEKYGKYLLRLELDGIKPVIPKSLVHGQKPSVLFTEMAIKALNTHDFNKFKIPFRANATDLETGREVTFASGYLPKVLQATTAVPMMLPPVEIGDKIYVDGGAVNNLPVNLVEEFDPDVIIAVDMGMELKTKEALSSLFPILSQSLAFAQKDNSARNRQRADIVIEPDISGYSFADWDKIEEVIEIGYQAAKAKMPAIRKLLASKGLRLEEDPAAHMEGKELKNVAIVGNTVYSEKELRDQTVLDAGSPFEPAQAREDHRALVDQYFYNGYKLARVKTTVNPSQGSIVHEIAEGEITAVKFDGRQYISETFLKDKIRNRKIFNIDDIKGNIDRLYATGFFESVGFTVIERDEGVTLHYLLKEKRLNTLALGLRYDTYQRLSLLADLTLNYLKTQNFKQTLSLKVGNEYNFRLTTLIWPEQFGKTLAGEASLLYYLKSQDIYAGSQLAYTYYYLTKGLRLAATADLKYFGQVSSGLEVLHVSYEKIFSLLPDERLSKFFIRTQFDLLDRPVMPRKGLAAKFEYQHGLGLLGGSYGFAKAKADLAAYYPLPRKHVVFAESKLYLGRDNVPLSENYRLGGADNLVGYGRDRFIGKHLAQLRLGYRFPLYLTPSPLLEGVYLTLLHDLGVVSNSLAGLKLENAQSGTGAEVQFHTFLGLAARLNVGFGQRGYVFLAIGNEF